MSNTLDAKLSVTQDDVEQIYGKINTNICSVSQTLDARLSEDHNKVKHICSQLETRICSVSETLDAKIAYNQNKIGDLAQTICSMSDISIATGQKLESRIGYLESNLQAIQILSKDENIKCLETYINEQNKKITESMKALETQMIQEVQTIRVTVVNRLQALDNLQSDTSESDASQINKTGHQRGLESPRPFRHQEDLPEVVRPSPVVFPDLHTQAAYDEHILSLCRTAGLNAWDKVHEPGERVELLFTKVEQGPTEQFQDFLQRLTTAVELQITDLETSKSIIYKIAYENANPTCKRILLPLKIRSAPLEEWVLHTANLHYNVQDTGAWIGPGHLLFLPSFSAIDYLESSSQPCVLLLVGSQHLSLSRSRVIFQEER
ncbi:Retroviral nucleocapsid protein Gag containing protein [Cricetulus griseus]|nr:Retroviral nucleocapsid protein Gag containing protein [Cricetulus griseus]